MIPKESSVGKRAVKFRAWDKKRHLMLEVDDIHFCCEEIAYLKGYDTENERDLEFDIYQETDNPSIEQVVLVQFSGLKDKNGKEIYEGDLINFNNEFGIVEKSSMSEWVVYFDGRDDREDLTSFCKEGEHPREISGNVFKNYNLLT